MEPGLSGRHFLLHGMIMFFFFIFSFLFFILGLFKYRKAVREKEDPKYRPIMHATRVLNIVVGICIAGEFGFMIVRPVFITVLSSLKPKLLDWFVWVKCYFTQEIGI